MTLMKLLILLILLKGVHVYSIVVPRSSSFSSEAMVDGKIIFIGYSFNVHARLSIQVAPCIGIVRNPDAPSKPRNGMNIVVWLLRGFIQCDVFYVLML